MKQLSTVVPIRNLLAAQLGQIWATTRAELAMQWRRMGVWFMFSLISIIGITGSFYVMSLYATAPSYIHSSSDMLMNDFINREVRACDTLLGIIVALLIADRFPRDRTLHMLELQQAAPFNQLTYIMGKFLGNLVAVVVPSAVLLMTCGLFPLLSVGSFVWLQSLGFSFILVFLPVFAIVIAFTLLFSTLLPLRPLQVALPFLWLYMTSSSEAGGSIARTPFSVAGLIVLGHFYSTESKGPTFSLPDVILNISLLLTGTVIFLLLAAFSLERRSERMLFS